MKSERLWIVVLSITWLLAGFAAGILVSLQRDPTRAAGDFAAYQARLIEAYDLDAVGAGRLAEIMAEYERDIERLKSRQLPELDPELVQVGQVCMDRIHDFIVPEARREEFRLLASGPFVTDASAE